MNDQIERMKQKIERLSEAAKAYYKEDREIMSNLEYDRLYDELACLEEETGVVLSDSPTVNIGYEVSESLPKETHETRMLSLDKTKEIETLIEWLGERDGLLSWKLDGLTIVMTYREGKLVKAITRGSGDQGEVITANARVFSNIPLSIPFKGELVLRGEAVIRYSDFEKINESIAEINAKYKNPRNLCSGSVRQLNNQVTAQRNVRFYVFALVKAEGADKTDELEGSRKAQVEWLKTQGFDVVEYQMVNRQNLEETVRWFSKQAAESDLPSDGLVLSFDDIAYGQSLGSTSKFPRDSIAFKWQDELKETKVKDIEWSASRTGLINPIAIFEPVELEGTTVSRASLHNISILKSLKLGIGDTVTVYKANMIIPQIAENLTQSEKVHIPEQCPICGEKTEIKSESGVETLFCANEDCLAKHVKSITHFVSRDAMNIEGLSEATIEKFIARGFIKEPADLFHLPDHKESIVSMEGFGEKSYNNLVDAAEQARKTTPVRLLYALGIPNIGVANAKSICKSCGWDWEKIQNLTEEELSDIYGIGDVMAKAYVNYFNSEKNGESVKRILAEIEFEKEDEGVTLLFEGKKFVITGMLERFDNRDVISEIIEKSGGKVTSAVTSKTSYLINNDVLSNSSKNKKARELGVPIISEDDFLGWIERRSLNVREEY